jgi:hypothetical protein
MTVADVVTQLKYGELRSIAAKDDLGAIVSYLNLALIALYGRFKISRAEQIINLQDNLSMYGLNPDVIAVEAIYDELGAEYPFNDDENLLSIFQPSYDTIQVPNAATGSQISVLYVQSPASLLVNSDSAVTNAQVVRIPSQLLEPLLHYIGYRAHASMNGDIKAENNTHYMRYEASVRRVKDEGLFRNDVVPASVNKEKGIDA